MIFDEHFQDGIQAILKCIPLSSFLPPGTFAVVSLMVSNAIENVLQSDLDVYSPCLNASMSEMDPYISSLGMNCSEIRVQIAVTVAMLSGIIMVGW